MYKIATKMSHFLFCLLFFCLSSNLGTLKSDRHLFVTNMNSSDNFCCTVVVVVVGICFPIFCCIVMLILQYVYSKPKKDNFPNVPHFSEPCLNFTLGKKEKQNV